MKSPPIVPKTRIVLRQNKPARTRSLAGIVRVLRRALPALSQKYGIHSLGVFGSYARREQNATSDLDVLVEFGAPPNLTTLLGLQEELSAVCGIQVEIVQNQLLKPYVGKHIRRQVIWLQKNGVPQTIRTLPSGGSKDKRMRNGDGMDVPKREYLDWIQDIISGMERAQRYVQGITYDEMMASDMTRDSVERAFERIGEAANRIPNEIRKLYPNIPWTNIVGMRNQIVHGYDAINYEIIWDTIHSTIPRDLPLVRAMLEQEKRRRNLSE